MTGVGQVGDRASRADRGQWSSDLHGSSADPRLPPRLLVAEEGRGIMLLKLFWLNSSVGLARGSNNMCAWRRSAVRTQRPTETRKTTTLMNMAGFDVREIHCQPEQCRKRAPHGCVRHTETCAKLPKRLLRRLPAGAPVAGSGSKGQVVGREIETSSVRTVRSFATAAWLPDAAPLLTCCASEPACCYAR